MVKIPPDNSREEIIGHRSTSISSNMGTTLFNLLKKDPIAQLEDVRLAAGPKNPLIPMIDELIQEFRRYDKVSEGRWHNFEGKLTLELFHFFRSSFQSFLYMSLLYVYFDSPESPIGRRSKNALRRKHSLTPAKFQKAVLEVLHNTAFEPVKKGGSEGYWSDIRKIRFLAYYNRFMLVIGNARRDKRTVMRVLRRQKAAEPEAQARAQVLAKYEIPPNLELSLFSDDPPREVALDWAIAEMEIEDPKREYLEKVLKGARKKWKSANENRSDVILIDVMAHPGLHKFGVKKTNEALMAGLKYTSVINPTKNDPFGWQSPYFIGGSF